MDVFQDGNAIRIDCPAKLNLFLEVIAKRSDGYHDIETLMTAISIYDSLSVTADPEARIRLTCHWASGLQARLGSSGLAPLPEETSNLVYKAAKRLAGEAGVTRGAQIRLIKRIPAQAGLGGASSDAAAALLALNVFWRLSWSRRRLAEIAAELGSDVPFFLLEQRSGTTVAVCRGRGERIVPVPGMPCYHLVVAKPPDGLSTASVYRQCSVPIDPRRPERLVEALQKGEIANGEHRLFNRLQEVAERLSPSVTQLRRTCEQLNIGAHAMSGSGSSYFALCRSATQARQLAVRMRAQLPGQVLHAFTV